MAPVNGGQFEPAKGGQDQKPFRIQIHLSISKFP